MQRVSACVYVCVIIACHCQPYMTSVSVSLFGSLERLLFVVFFQCNETFGWMAGMMSISKGCALQMQANLG